jgi:hypothetical protein
MKTHRLLAPFFLLVILAAPPAKSPAADVLQHLPNDALCFVKVENLGATDGKIEQLLKTLRVEFPAPLAFLQSATGIQQGIDAQGEFLFAMLGAEQAAQPQFCVWLPVREYDQFIAALDGAGRDEISAVTVAGEDLLVARHGDWALVMDPDQRERMEQVLSAKPNPPAVVALWKRWLDANDVAVVILRSGLRAALAWAADAPTPAGNESESGDEPSDDIFGQTENANEAFTAAPRAAQAPGGAYEAARTAIRKWIIQSAKLNELVLQADAIGCAARLDADGNAVASLRIKGLGDKALGSSTGVDDKVPPALYQDLKFVLYGVGHVPPAFKNIAADVYSRMLLEELKTEERMVLNDEAAAAFQSALEQATADILSALIVTQPGNKHDAVSTNNFLVVRVASADSFTEHASEVLRLWNKMHRDAEGPTRMIFDIEEVQVGTRTAIQYSLDVASLVGGEALPEIRQSMEKFFGPGGKMRLWVAPVDDQVVLLAAATPEQVADAWQVLARNEAPNLERAALAPANALLPRQSDWRLFFDPHGYNAWHRRQTDAMTGPVLGGRPAKDFPSSPPIGAAGGIRDDELWLDVAVPAATIQSAGEYRKK